MNSPDVLMNALDVLVIGRDGLAIAPVA